MILGREQEKLPHKVGETPSQESQLILILDDDTIITEGLAAGLEREGRTLITCNDVESAEMIVERMHPSHIVADIRLTGPFGYEGLDFIRFAKRHTPESRIILISGDAPEALQLEASERGAVAFLKKPFEVRELDTTIDMLRCSAISARSGHDRVIRMTPLDDIVRSDALRPQFQPVVRLGAEPNVFGYESLTRFRTDSPLRDPEVLFNQPPSSSFFESIWLALLVTRLHPFASATRLRTDFSSRYLRTTSSISAMTFIVSRCSFTSVTHWDQRSSAEARRSVVGKFRCGGLQSRWCRNGRTRHSLSGAVYAGSSSPVHITSTACPN